MAEINNTQNGYLGSVTPYYKQLSNYLSPRTYQDDGGTYALPSPLRQDIIESAPGQSGSTVLDFGASALHGGVVDILGLAEKAYLAGQGYDTGATLTPGEAMSVPMAGLLTSAATKSVPRGALGMGAAPRKVENDLLNPVGKSRMVGEEISVLETPDLTISLADTPWTNKQSLRYVKYEDGEPIAVLQIGRDSARSKKATIQNVYVREDKRRQHVAADLLKRARQDYDVKHSTDLTEMGRKFKAAEGKFYSNPASGSSVGFLSQNQNTNTE